VKVLSSGRIPLWVKLLYTLFVLVLVPNYLIAYGPTNFLYFCDVALLLTVAAVWFESALLASAAAVGIVLPQCFWMVDFLGSAVGLPVTGMTGYMFNGDLPLFARFLSFFHFWLPLFLLWLVSRLGYDRRAPGFWTPLALALMLISYFFLPPPPPPADNPGLPVNVNYVFGLSDEHAQQWMPPVVWLLGLMAVMPLAIFWPTHLLFKRIFRPPQRLGRSRPESGAAAG
jgi:hypothetical protein